VANGYSTKNLTSAKRLQLDNSSCATGRLGNVLGLKFKFEAILKSFEIRVEHRLAGYAHREKGVCAGIVLQ
jgi:hypothetical protein